MAPEFQPAPPPGAAVPAPQQDAAPNTCLKWGENGELSPVDLQRVLERLTDQSMTRCPLDV
ncbi:MAG: hypothetical protein ACKOE9_09330 [Vulcanococcus sp.]